MHLVDHQWDALWRGPLRLRRVLVGLGVAVLLVFAGPAIAMVGEPPVTKLKPNVDAPPQNADLVQDDSALLYIANGRGIMMFDGESWQLMPLPNGDLVSTVAYDGHSRIYVGAHNLLGYLERDDTGWPAFHDLTPIFREQLKGEEFGDATSLVVTGAGVFWVSTNFAFRYDPASDHGTVWRHAGRFGAITVQGGQPILQFRGEGLRRFEGEDWVPMAGSQGLSELAFDIAPLPDGGLLSMSSDGHWRIYRGDAVHDKKMPDGLPAASMFNVMRLLADGTIALGATDGDVWIYNASQDHAERVRVTDGPINGIVSARDGGMLVLSDLAVFHLDWPGDWTTIGPRNGVSGTVHSIARWNQRWYVLANNGAHESDGDSLRSFHALDWTDNDVWDMLPTGPDSALLAELYRLKVIEHGRATTFGDHDLYPRLLVRSRFDPDLVYVGTEYGVAVLRHRPSGWELILDRGRDEQRVDSLIELGPDDILAGSSHKGVARIHFASDHTRIASSESLGAAQGIHYDAIGRAALSMLSGTGVVASTGVGLYRWSDDHFVALSMDGIDANDHSVLRFVDGPDGGAWAFGGNSLYQRVAGANWQRAEIGNIVNGYIEALAFDGRDATLIGCASAILRHEAVSGAAPLKTPGVLLRSVEENAFSHPATEPRYALAPAEPLHLANDLNISFHFALPDFHGARETQYQARLFGRDEQFTQWQAATTYQYRHLPPGNYRFVAVARDRQGHMSETVPYSFVIEPPWYETRWAETIWAILGLAGVAALTAAGIAWRTKRFVAKRTELEGVVAERTRELVDANHRLQDLAHRDVLTGLANRALFEARLEQARAAAIRHHRRFAVLFVDLDQFKTVNDSMGHEAGDRLLRELAARLSAKLRREDTLARWGGDEFMVLAEDLPSLSDVAVIAQTLVDVGSAPFTLSEGHVVALSTSVGVSVYPDDSSTPAELIRNADTAMYSAKSRGGNQVCFYAAEMTDQARSRLAIVNGLRTAVERRELRLHYQPILDVLTGEVVGAEALLRWQRETGELMPPALFVPIAESSDLILSIGAWVLKEACAAGRVWTRDDPRFNLAVNVSPRQLRSTELVRVVREALQESGMPPAQLILEITESTIAEVGDEAQLVIDGLKALGVHLAVDDFGTGLSALSSLKKLRVDSLKIDRSFVRDLPNDSGDAEIAATIVAMGHNLRLTVTAEGVETTEQLDYLRACGCDRYQGFLFSPGVAHEAFLELLERARGEAALAQ